MEIGYCANCGKRFESNEKRIPKLKQENGINKTIGYLCEPCYLDRLPDYIFEED